MERAHAEVLVAYYLTIGTVSVLSVLVLGLLLLLSRLGPVVPA